MSPPRKTDGPLQTMVVGNLQSWKARGLNLPDGDGLHFVEYTDLSSGMIAVFQPELVLSQLLGKGFDAIDLAARLEEIGFAGRFRVIAPGLPHPELVCEEVALHAPSIDFDVLNLPNERI